LQCNINIDVNVNDAIQAWHETVNAQCAISISVFGAPTIRHAEGKTLISGMLFPTNKPFRKLGGLIWVHSGRRVANRWDVITKNVAISVS